MLQIILTPFSWLLTAFHDFFYSYGIALILFALVVKIILFPFSLKGKRSMIQMNMVSGKVQQIQKQYAKNKEKMNEEIQKLYAKENVNPMGGCLWSFIPILVLWPLYAIIRRPFFYMMGQTNDTILAIANALGFTAGTGELTSSNVSAGYNELKMAGMMTADNLGSVQTAANDVVSGLGDKIFQINFNFLGLDLSQIADWKFWTQPLNWAHIGLFLLPIISAVLALVMSWVSQKTNAMNKQQEKSQMNQQMKMMMFISPLISLWIGYAMPAGLCIYWIINNILSIAQELVCGRLLKKDYEKAAAAQAERERLEKEEEKRKKQEAAERRAKAIEDAKNNKGKKKPVEKPEKKKPGTTDAGRIGMRPYARGRCYDPDRYGGVTPYQDPGAPIDEEAVEQALQAKAEAEAAAAESAEEEILALEEAETDEPAEKKEALESAENAEELEDAEEEETEEEE